jgi:hypothetical protein
MKQNVKNYIASFFVGNWLFKLTQFVLLLNIVVSVIYSLRIWYFLFFPPYGYQMDGLTGLMIFPLFLAASIILGIMFLFRSLKDKSNNRSLFITFLVFGCLYLIFLILSYKYETITFISKF